MFNLFAKVTKTADLSAELKKQLNELAGTQVFIGVPDGSDSNWSEDITNAELLYVHTHGVRQKEMREEMNPKVESGELTYSKAVQMYLHTHGSPLWHSPPRPVIEPALESKKEVIAKQLRKVAEFALDGQDYEVELQKAGLLGQNIARAWFDDPSNGWAPNSPVTEEAKGSDRPLIDTGELRKSIMYVVEKGNKA
ncbi:hypothetical protein GC093_20515 [Paenibacillus sp. LMG 31456]|uniref:Uncharacterized protein n=1 Tax=Paenibacillus foliorum TaxID=2654974 RepID=A0A972GZ86_9BACL|nr:hypothetical protein [Paenibacillus foliorum]NOU95595.1 hypothetical protein [Paenibacillus foliorum]